MIKRKNVFGWIMYDWANSAFATTIMAAVLPIYYYDVAFQGHNQAMASTYWAISNSAAMVLIALLAPLFGAIADYSGSKKSFLRVFTYLGALASAGLVFVGVGDYLLASFLLLLGTIAFNGGNTFYDAFLPEVAKKEEMDSISARGYAFGYIGGGILLLINLLMIQKPDLFGIPNKLLATQLCFVTVGVWWFLFSLPMFRYVQEHKPTDMPARVNYLKEGVTRLKKTFSEISRYRELLKFLIAFWLYNDGISTIMKMATIYGKEIGIETNDLIIALLITQFVGIPFALIFGWLAGKIGNKTALYLSLCIYVVIVVLGYFMENATHFYILATGVGFVQGGSQALSRSLFGSMVPADKHAEFFGFFGVSNKFSAIFGPFLFAFVKEATGSSRWGVVSMAFFFIAGMLILSRVNFKKGQLEAATQEIGLPVS